MALRMLVFFAVMTLIVVGIHVYVGRRLVPPLDLRPPARRRAYLALGLSCVLILLTFALGRLFEPGWATRILNWVGFSALGGIGMLFALTVGRDALLGLSRALPLTPAPTSPSRREALAQLSSLAVLGTGGLLAAGSLVQGHRRPRVEEVPIGFPGLPADLEGFTVAQISDLHLGPVLGREYAAEVAAQVSELDADVVAVTGDLVDGRVRDLASAVAPLADMRSRHGVYFVTGNHEYYWDGPAWTEHLKTLGWDVLVNEHRILRVGDARLALGGVTDVTAGSFHASHRSDPVGAFRGAEEADFRLLLAHQPKSLHGAREAGVHLQLSGHTHAGQVFPMNLLVHLAHPIVQGLGRFGDTTVYVNRGTATWGPPMRTGPPGEITRVVLTRAT